MEQIISWPIQAFELENFKSQYSDTALSLVKKKKYFQSL